MSKIAFEINRAPEIAADARAGLAHTMYEALSSVIGDFQAELAANQEVGAILTSFGQRITIAVTSIGYQNPHLIVFYGVADGQEVQLVQHTSQVNLMLVPLPATTEPARRIGFDVPE